MMGADGDWVAPVIAFLSGTVPRHGDGWDHKFSTAYQIGCEALVALGEATEVRGGAVRREVPVLPKKLPRWDDICIAVLKLAEQQNKFAFRLPDGSCPAPRTTWRVVGAPPPPPPNILPIQGMGPARADEEVLSVLTTLGLIRSDGHWTNQAELVLWRVQPHAWAMDVTTDQRFLGAARNAVDTIPADKHTQIKRLVTISQEDIDAHIRRHDDAVEESRAKYGPKARLSAPMTPERARNSLHFLRRDELDWIFFCHWRLHEGWLTSDQAANALQIFHDPLAIQMRRAVVGRLHPDLPDFSEQTWHADPLSLSR